MMRRYRRRPDLDNPFWWFGALLMGAITFAFYMLVLEIWLMWALIALPIMGIAKLSHNDELAQAMTRSLKWKMLRFR
jgi:hypothetical protein